MEGKSYERIAERIGCQPEEITFLTDVTRGKFYNYDDQLSMKFKLVHVLKGIHSCMTCDINVADSLILCIDPFYLFHKI